MEAVPTAGTFYSILLPPIWEGRLPDLRPQSLFARSRIRARRHPCRFGQEGLWQFLDGARWQRIHSVSPIAIAAGDLDGNFQDEAIAGFAGLGLLARYNDKGPWVKLHDTAPSRIVAGDFDGDGTNDLAGDFGALGLLVRFGDAGWVRRGAASQGLVVSDIDGNGKDEVILDLGAEGLWALYHDRRRRLHTGSPLRVVAGDFDATGQDDLAVDFASGLWLRYNVNGPWEKVRDMPSEGLATGELNGGRKNELIADFGASGLHVRYSDFVWVKRDNRNPTGLLATDIDLSGKDEIIAGFGAGLWARFNDAGTFRSIRKSSPQALVAGSFN